MARVKVADLVADTKGLQNFIRIVQRGRGSFTAKGLYNGAQHLRRYYINRFRTKGYGSWNPLSPEYRKRKPFNKNRTLILSGQLMMAVEVTAANHQRTAFEVGYGGPRSSRSYRNPTSQKYFDFHGTVLQLAEIHQATRPIIVPPTQGVKNKIIQSIQGGVDKDVRRANSGR